MIFYFVIYYLLEDHLLFILVTKFSLELGLLKLVFY